MRRAIRLAGVGLGAFTVSYLLFAYGGQFFKGPPPANPPGMVWVPGGEFTMGTDGRSGWTDEKPAHRVRVAGFWMDETDVTNAQFRAFVEATGYVTTAEQPVDAEEVLKQRPPNTPPPPPERLVPGSLVFQPTPGPVKAFRDVSQWWHWTADASWRHPEGPGSSIEGREDHPVVHVSWFDAVAYAKWAGKRLPTVGEFSAVLRKIDGQWYFESVREGVPQPASNAEHFAGLEWLIGDWKGEETKGEASTASYSWAENQNFIVCTFSTMLKGIPVVGGTQWIAWDAIDKKVRSWSFYSGGGFGEAVWTRDGNKWVIETKARTADGKKVSVTNTITRVDDDNAILQVTRLTVDGKMLPDPAPQKLKRVKEE